jgi:putative nucleotidyltransferase with HDIG domain
VIVATLAVAVLPSLLLWGLRAVGDISSTPLSVVLAVLLSLVICQAGGAYWQRVRGTQDVLFGDLMIWGWVRRRRAKSRLAKASALLATPPRELPRTPLGLSAAQRMNLLQRLAHDLESFDPYTHGHSRRVARYSTLIARRMGLPRAEIRKIRAAGLLHDVGKLYVPHEILNKPERLTDEQYEVMKRHPLDGARLIRLLVGDQELADIVGHHHERLDGTGYPSGQAGEEIPIGSRIIAVADTFDAITSERPYRAPKPHKAAIDVMHQEAGTALDPDAVRAFSSVYFGWRPLGAFVVSTNTGEGLLSGLLARIAATARVAGAAAGVAAIGTGALSVPAIVGAGGSTGTPALAALAPSAAPSGSSAFVSLLGPAMSHHQASQPHRSLGTPSSRTRGTVTRPGAPSHGGSSSGGGSTGGGSSNGSGGSGGTPSSPVPVSVSTPPHTGVSAGPVSATVTTAPDGSSASAGLHVAGAASASVSAGTSGASVQASTPAGSVSVAAQSPTSSESTTSTGTSVSASSSGVAVSTPAGTITVGGKAG